ncbi:ABC transporter substrate-binding protein [Roseinatronobacter alkalisoli]|uniref:ABC transporter substrate-binding protein n=1 Tax=Roseinatronobacter alkalisoli TaxID=3028235 RepID=A0ABT5TC63_9RHOB|nr:ABC transporter substrate-binding protein [Roseinatronobacter sp. HJB301]MDD7972719.1 ABC transporter substrate-binding protein [Roseinatronobacter sp. HJB301]
MSLRALLFGAAFTSLAVPVLALDRFPHTDVNCDVTTVFEAPPQRAVTLSNNATEIMLALGLQEHLVGTSYMGNLEIGPEYAESYARIPVLSPLIATTEQLIEVEADFVYAGYPDGFSERWHTRDQLHDLGMTTRLATEGCNLGRFDFSNLWQELRDVAAIFGVPDRAEALIEGLQARLDAVDAALDGAEPVHVFIYNGGDAPPRAALGNTMLHSIVTRAGGAHIFGDIEMRYGTVSWENIVERDPAHIVVFYSLTEAGQVVADPRADIAGARIELLSSFPAMADVTAVREGRFHPVSSATGQPGPSSVRAVEELARLLHPERFAQ